MFKTQIPNGIDYYAEKDRTPPEYVVIWQDATGRWHPDRWTSLRAEARRRVRAVRANRGCIAALSLSHIEECPRPANLVKHGSHYRTYVLG